MAQAENHNAMPFAYSVFWKNLIWYWYLKHCGWLLLARTTRWSVGMPEGYNHQKYLSAEQFKGRVKLLSLTI